MALHPVGPSGDTVPGRALAAVLFAGTPPATVTLAPAARSLRTRGAHVEIVATGQHHDHRMAGAFFADLDMEPEQRWTLDGDEAARVGGLLTHALAYFAVRRPDVAV